MILVADSGSTKTAWISIDDTRIHRCRTSGLNPVHMDSDHILAILKQEFSLPVHGITAVYFYGAGCLPRFQSVMRQTLVRFFGETPIEVDTDLLGVCRGLFGNREGIAAILGTGSNSARYDGVRVTENIPPLGYILGDEGSGAVLGKRFIGDLLKGLLPKSIDRKFFSRFDLSYSEIIERIYQGSEPNRFLSGIVPFVAENRNEPAIASIIDRCFGEFIERNLLRYSDIGALPLCFCGSIAVHFEPELRRALQKFDLEPDRITVDPTEGLIAYHCTKKS